MLVSCHLFIIQGPRLHHCCVCFHAIFMSPLWLNHPSLSWYLQMSLMGPRLHWSTQCSALQWSFIIFCSAVKTLRQRAVCSSDSWDRGDYIFIRRSVRRQVGWGGEAAELHSHQGEGRKRQIALPEIIYNLLRKQSSASRRRKNSKLLIFFWTNMIDKK